MKDPSRPMLDRRSFVAGGVAVVVATSAMILAEPGRDAQQMADDWPWLGRYRAANRAIIASGKPVQTVFMGDSITEGWPRLRPGFFPQGRVGRGISGQTTPQMVLRMMADVIALKPRAVHIMGGTNDVAGNTGPITQAETVANIRAMIALAQDAGIAVLLGAIPPASTFFWRPEARPRDAIIALNRALAGLARERHAVWIDYHAALNDGAGGLDRRYSDDGVHPNAAGYAVMEKLAAPLILQAERPRR